MKSALTQLPCMLQALQHRIRSYRYPQTVFAWAIVSRIGRDDRKYMGRIVDLPCGEGEVARELSRSLKCHVIGIDISAECIRRAWQNTVEDVRFETADLYDYLVREQGIDVLCIVNSLFCLTDARRAIDLCLTAIRPGGSVFVVIPNIHSPNYRAFHRQNPCVNKWAVSAPEARAFFEAVGFRVVSFKGVARARWYGRSGLRWLRSSWHLYLLAENYCKTLLSLGTPSYFVIELAKQQREDTKLET